MPAAKRRRCEQQIASAFVSLPSFGSCDIVGEKIWTAYEAASSRTGFPPDPDAIAICASEICHEHVPRLGDEESSRGLFERLQALFASPRQAEELRQTVFFTVNEICGCMIASYSLQDRRYFLRALWNWLKSITRLKIVTSMERAIYAEFAKSSHLANAVHSQHMDSRHAVEWERKLSRWAAEDQAGHAMMPSRKTESSGSGAYTQDNHAPRDHALEQYTLSLLCTSEQFEKRDEVRVALERSLQSPCSDDSLAQDLATSIENELFLQLVQNVGDKAKLDDYILQARAICFNLRDPSNTGFVRSVLLKEIQTANLPTMDARSMASSERTSLRASWQKDALESVIYRRSQTRCSRCGLPVTPHVPCGQCDRLSQLR